jgi:hypothetical protein
MSPPGEPSASADPPVRDRCLSRAHLSSFSSTKFPCSVPACHRRRRFQPLPRSISSPGAYRHCQRVAASPVRTAGPSHPVPLLAGVTRRPTASVDRCQDCYTAALPGAEDSVTSRRLIVVQRASPRLQLAYSLTSLCSCSTALLSRHCVAMMSAPSTR